MPTEFYSDAEIRSLVDNYFTGAYSINKQSSNNNQVYSIVPEDGAKAFLKVAGKGRFKKHNNVIKEYMCMSVLKQCGISIPKILHSHYDYTGEVRPFIIMEEAGKYVNPKERAHNAFGVMEWEGRFIKQLSQLSPAALTVATFKNIKLRHAFQHGKELLSPYRTTPFFINSYANSLQDILSEVSLAKADLKSYELDRFKYIEDSLEKLEDFIRANSKSLVLGQWQAGEVLITDQQEPGVIDWSEGLSYTLPLRSIWTRLHWIEAFDANLLHPALDYILAGYFGHSNFNKQSILAELQLWRCLRAVSIAFYLARTQNNDTALRQLTRYNKPLAC